MDRFESMTAFVAVARAGGFSAAARTMGTPLATLSRRVADLESAIGVRLFQRSTRQVTLTESGRGYLAACQRLLDDLKEAEESASGEYRAPRGELVVTAPLAFGRMHLQPVAHEFMAAFPDISVRLLLADRVVDLVEEHVDVALRIATLASSGLVARPVGLVRVVVAGSRGYLERRGTPRQPSELAKHEGIPWSWAPGQGSWPFKVGARERSFAVPSRFTTTTAESAVEACVAGLGLARVASYQAAPGLRTGELVLVLRDFEPAPTPVSLVYAGNRLVPLKLRAFIDFAAPRLTAQLKAVEATVQARRRRPKMSAATR